MAQQYVVRIMLFETPGTPIIVGPFDSEADAAGYALDGWRDLDLQSAGTIVRDTLKLVTPTE